MSGRIKRPAILIYLDADLKREVEAAAKADDRSVTSWIVQLLKKAVAK